jgi:hypothetical protein
MADKPDIILKATAGFFDRKAVLSMLDKRARGALSRFGAFVRRRARSSMRPGGKSGKVAAPGQPPRTHAGNLKRLLFFSWDATTKSVVIGPVPFAGGVAPSLLEFGGTTPGHGRTIYITRAAGRDARGQFKSKGKAKVVLNGTVRYRGNPFMGPALRAETPNMPRAWSTAAGR